MNKLYLLTLLTAFLMLTAFSCGTPQKATANSEKATPPPPEFDADTAYRHIQAQVDFGPRVPNTPAHKACGDYLAGQLAAYGATVTNQYADLTAYDGTLLKARNIIGSFQPQNKKRILLCAHWDTRPWADNDPDENNHRKPVLGANDGASGVGVLLETARLLQQRQPAVGIDIIFFDAEDYGTHRNHNGPHKEEHWCLGSQYWSRYPHTPGYNARFGILLDMVGGPNPTFCKELYSEEYAKNINTKVWQKAEELGYKRWFTTQEGGYVTDDHLFVNRLAGIPCIDIIPNESTNTQSNFGSTWHTVHDDMSNIDKATLKAVGQTILTVIHTER